MNSGGVIANVRECIFLVGGKLPPNVTACYGFITLRLKTTALPNEQPQKRIMTDRRLFDVFPQSHVLTIIRTQIRSGSKDFVENDSKGDLQVGQILYYKPSQL